MADAFDLDEPSDEEKARMDTLLRVYIHDGWARHLPGNGLAIAENLACEGPMTRAQLSTCIATNPHTADGLASDAWPPSGEWTDEQLREADEEDAFPGDQVQSAKEANEQEATTRAAQIKQMDINCAALEVRAVRTLDDLLDFLVACNVVTVDSEGGHDWYDLNEHPPFPTEILALTDDAKAAMDQLRWSIAHDKTAQKIIRLFNPDADDPLHLKRTTLEKLARDLAVEVETARAGLIALVDDPDFTMKRDPERIREHEVFELSVDWDLFAQTRIGISAG